MVKLITHTDLDGIGAEILGNLFFSDISVTNADYPTVNDLVQRFLEVDFVKDKYTHIFITDISVNSDIAEMLNDVADKVELRLFDHHQTAEWLNRYDWAFVAEEKEDKTGKYSGTSLFSDYLLKTYKLKDGQNKENIERFSELVRRYDTWEWKKKYNDEIPKKLNDLFYTYGKVMFVKDMVNKLTNNDELFNEQDDMILAIENNRINNYVTKKEKRLREFNLNEHKVGLVYAEQYFSDLTLSILKNRPDLDYLIIVDIDTNGVSYRTLKPEVNVGLIAKNYGGGGHPEAAGSPLNNGMKSILLNTNLL